jgi:hypothetical protein
MSFSHREVMHGVAARLRGEDMTVKRDFKRRVRQRQVRTGESYVTARRHLLASRPAVAGPADPEDDDEPPAKAATAAGVDVIELPPGGSMTAGTVVLRPRISVIELVDVTEQARQIGLSCRVMMYPSLIERIAPARVLEQLHGVLMATAGDRALLRLSRLALRGDPPAPRRQVAFDFNALRMFLYRARAGLGGVLDDGSTLAFHVSDGDGLVPILCTLSAQDTAIELSAIANLIPERWAALEPLLVPERPAPVSAVPMRRFTEELTAALLGGHRGTMPWPPLYVVFRGRRQVVRSVPFLIGRNPVCHLAIDADGVASEHAVVLLNDDGAYLKPLDTPQGVIHRGRRIDRKWIEEGDVFELGGQEIRFTFKPE